MKNNDTKTRQVCPVLLTPILQTAFVLTICMSFCLSANAETSVGEAQAKLFGVKCAGCHTVGKGKLVGPDLNDVSNWPVDDLKAAVVRMQTMAGPLTDTEIKSLVTFLKNKEASELIKKSEEHKVSEAATAAPASEIVGKELFVGAKSFTNGGPSCIACHSAEGSGGTMGPDLTDVFTKFGENALVSACEQTNFKVMKAVYKDHPVTRQEALHLTRYFGSIKGAKKDTIDPPVNLIGFGGAALFLIGLTFMYKRRKGSARDQLNRR